MSFNLQSALVSITARITPEQKAEDERFQREMREKLGSRANPDAPEERILRALSQEREVIKQIEFLRLAPKTVLRDRRLTQSLNRYAELLAERGLFRQAAGIAFEETRRAYYAKIADALEHPVFCNCADEQIRDTKTGREMNFPARHKIIDIFTDGAMKGLYQCRFCDNFSVE